MGGAIFIREGAIVTAINTSFNNNSATAGFAGTPGASDGLGKGGAIFLMTGADFVDGGGLAFSGNTAEDGGPAGSLDNDDIFGLSVGGGLQVTIANDEVDGDLSPGDLSLREAIANAANGDTITFDPSLAIIAVDQGDLFVDIDLSIVGNGVANTIIDGGTLRVYSSSTAERSPFKTWHWPTDRPTAATAARPKWAAAAAARQVWAARSS